MDALLSQALNAHGGLERWSRLSKITAQLSIGGPIWAAKGWPGALAQETVEIDLSRERSVFTPFTHPDYRSVFETGPERVTIETTSGQPPISDCRRAPPSGGMSGPLRGTGSTSGTSSDTPSGTIW
jgi:hypothetical protein